MTRIAGQIGSQDRATRIAMYHHGSADAWQDSFEHLASGSHRTVYIDWNTDVVYKLGIDAVNRREVRTLAELRGQGVAYTPEASLYEVSLTDQWGEQIDCTVVAMPYLPDDGSVNGERPILVGSGDFNAANTHANGGQWWLIDAGGL